MNRTRFPSVYFAALLTFGGFSLLPSAVAHQEDKPATKAQSVVAAKDKTFATVAASDAKVKSALDAKDLEKARKQVGKTSSFTGTVVKVFSPDSNSVVILNFAKNYKEALTAVVKPSAYSKFPDLTTLKDKKVLISGKFVEYKNSVEIELMALDQIKLIK